MTDELFPMTPAERLERLRMFIRAERRQRMRMLDRHGDRTEYWCERIDECDEMMEHLDELREVLP